LFGFDGLSVACTYWVWMWWVILWVMLWNALEPSTSDGQGYM